MKRASSLSSTRRGGTTLNSFVYFCYCSQKLTDAKRLRINKKSRAHTVPTTKVIQHFNKIQNVCWDGTIRTYIYCSEKKKERKRNCVILTVKTTSFFVHRASKSLYHITNICSTSQYDVIVNILDI